MSCSTSSSGNANRKKNKRNKIQSINHEGEEEDELEEERELPYHFEKELINNQNRHIHIKDEFIPSHKTQHITAKYYARHENALPWNYYKYYEFVEKPQKNRRTTQLLPRLESQQYGWLPKPVNRISLLKQLNYVNAPKQRCFMTAYGEKLISETITERPDFNGLRFFLR